MSITIAVGAAIAMIATVAHRVHVRVEKYFHDLHLGFKKSVHFSERHHDHH